MEGFVAFLDILGFSELVKNGDLFDKFPKYSEIIKKSLETDEDTLQYIIFSDSVIINSINKEDDVLLSLIEGISRISHLLVTELDMPICGCISEGEFVRMGEEGNVNIAGSPILDAYYYEQQQDWIGVMLSPRILRHKSSIADISYISDVEKIDYLKVFERHLPWKICIQRNENIPFKQQTYDGYAIVPTKKSDSPVKEIQENLFQYWYHLENIKCYCPDPTSQKKYERTISWIQEVSTRWDKIKENAIWQKYNKLG